MALLVAFLFVGLAAPASRAADITRHDRNVIRFFQHHPALARTPAGGAALAALLPRVVRSLEDADAAAANPYPPHHALWECIHRYEASSWSAESSNGHYGGLQMTYGWLGYVQGNPAVLSEAQQEWAAERAWAASGYSYAFLEGQWYDWDAADGCGTTG